MVAGAMVVVVGAVVVGGTVVVLPPPSFPPSCSGSVVVEDVEVVELDEVDEVVDDVVVAAERSSPEVRPDDDVESDPRLLPVRSSWSGSPKSVRSTSSSASTMKSCQIWAGIEPPCTVVPSTVSIDRLPSA